MKFVKHKESDHVWWRTDNPAIGVREFSFDRKNVFNLFSDYPHKLTKKQKEVFDKENPSWVEFFKDRQ